MEMDTIEVTDGLGNVVARHTVPAGEVTPTYNYTSGQVPTMTVAGDSYPAGFYANVTRTTDTTNGMSWATPIVTTSNSFDGVTWGGNISYSEVLPTPPKFSTPQEAIAWMEATYPRLTHGD